MSMAPETTKSFAGHHIDSDGSMDVRSSNAATLAGIDAAAPLHDLEPDTVSHGSDEDIYLRHDSNKTKAHHRGIRKSMTKVKNVIKKPFNAKHETEPCHCHGIRHSSSSDPADPEVITTHPLNANAPCSSSSPIKPGEERFTTKPKARTFSTSTKKVAKKAGPALLALAIGVAEHYLNNASF